MWKKNKTKLKKKKKKEIKIHSLSLNSLLSAQPTFRGTREVSSDLNVTLELENCPAYGKCEAL